MSSTRASPTMRSSWWQRSSEPCTCFTRRGGDHLGAASSVATPTTSSLTTPRGRSSTPLTSTTTSTKTTPAARAMTRGSTALRTRRRRSFRRSCPERVLHSTTLTSLVMTLLAQRRMRIPSSKKATSPAFASWASLLETSLTLTLM
jgi:hypothetical protein